MGFRPYRLNPDIYEAGPFLRWKGPHTGALLFGVKLRRACQFLRWNWPTR